MEFNNKKRPAYRVARVSKLLDHNDDNRDYEIKCVRRSQNPQVSFEFPQKTEVLLIEHERVKMILPQPRIETDLLYFSVDLSKYNMM